MQIEMNYGAQNEGFIAQGNGLPVEANPFKAGTQDHHDWYLGWCEGYGIDEDNKARFAKRG